MEAKLKLTDNITKLQLSSMFGKGTYASLFFLSLANIREKYK